MRLKRLLTPEIDASAVSVTGPVREDNQDAVLLPDTELHPALPGSLFAVADGMGGYAHGGMASALALETLSTTLAQASGSQASNGRSAAPARVLRQGVEAANLSVFKAAQGLSAGRMGTTLTAAYILGNQLHLAHVGDSRAYLIRNGQATCLTNDHTVVGDMVRSRLIAPDRVRTHAQRSILTRAVGLGLFIQPDLSQWQLRPGDWLILCCDGVWSVLQDDDFARLSRRATSAQALGEALIALSIEHASDDNCSVVAAQICGFSERVAPALPPAPGRNGHGWISLIKKTFQRKAEKSTTNNTNLHE